MKHKLLNKLLFLTLLTWGGVINSAWATTYKLTKVTTVSAGNKYVFERKSRVLNNTISSSSLQTTTTYSKSGLSGSETYIWELETATGGFYLKNTSLNSNQYLNNPSSTSVAFGSKSSIWSISFTDDVALISNKSNSNRFLGETTSSSNVYKAYATSNLSSYGHDFTVYQVEEEVSMSPVGTFEDIDDVDDATKGSNISFNPSDYYTDDAGVTGTTVLTVTPSSGDIYYSEGKIYVTSYGSQEFTVTATPAVADASSYEAVNTAFTVTCPDTRTAVNLTGFSATNTTLIVGGSPNTTATTATNNQGGWTAAYTYSSSNTSVATVNSSGIITAVAKGTARITCSLNVDAEDTGYKSGATTSMYVDITVKNPSHTATFSVNGNTSSEDFEEGTVITFPSGLSDMAGKSFVGWVKSTIDGTTDEAPSFVDTAFEEMGSDDITYYAVFAIAEESGEPVETKAQILQYDTWSYSGPTTDKNTYRLFGNGSYIESEAFDLSKLSKVIVYGGTFGGNPYNSLTIGDGTNTWKSVTVTTSGGLGDDTYTDGTPLTGTKKLRITATAGDGSNNGLRISKVEIFIQEPSISYSAYCTTIIITKVETPVISPASGAVASGTMVTISCATDGATIYYTTDGTNPTTSSEEYSEAIEITSAQTIKAIAVKDGLTDSEVASASYTIALPCTTPTFSVAAGEVAIGTTVTISTATDGATIYYTTNGDTPTAISPIYSSAITINNDQTIKAIAVKDGMLNSEVASVTYTVINYTTLPFNWAGGISSDLTALTGVTANGLGDNYASSNAPYRVRMDSEGDYIQVKTNAQPGRVYVGVKMVGGASTSKIKVQESANGTDFTDVNEFTISGAQNSTHSFETTGIFSEASRYVRIIKSVHGSNIGVGPITITGCESVTVSDAGYATLVSASPLDFKGKGIEAYIATTKGDGTGVNFTKVNKVPANTGILLHYDNGTTENIPVFDGTSPDATSGNVFVPGTGAAVATDGGTTWNYILNNVGGNVGFYKAAGNTVAANRAYISILKSETLSLVKEFISLPGMDDDATGISLTPTPYESKGAIYNLAGQRMNKMQKGINIVNGKKVMK